PTPSWTDLVEVHGFGVVWLTPLHEPTVPAWVERPGVDTFYVRFARVLVQARPTPDFLASVHVAIENPNPFFNYELTWQGLPYVNVTAGQMRIPFGASITTPAPTLVMWDRPRFMYVMSKEAFRDIGVLVHSPRGGLLGGALEYYLGLFNGSGRTRANIPILERDLHEYLVVARAVFNAAPPMSLPNGSRLALGASYAHAVDPAVTAMDATQAAADAAHFLGGTLTPFVAERETHLVSWDLTFSAFDLWAQAELVYLYSTALDGSARAHALGASIEAAYAIRAIFLQPAARFEYFDPDFETGGRSVMIFSLGANFDITPQMRLSAFYSHERYEQMAVTNTDNRVRARYMIRF
ncbi:MAG: hypothetical protein K8H88_03340, partial [Sandaracinaceae bacterium]|nr:hypothetical protein [Sandaracinaceae bacterium]